MAEARATAQAGIRGGARVEVRNLEVRYGAASALSGLDLDVAPGELFVLLGGSGSGKTTLLRALAGFVRPSEGSILLDGQDIAALPPHRRPVSTTFQSYALFPHLSVADNVAFGLRRQGWPRGRIAPRVAEMLALVRMAEYAARRPSALSGGQRQRVALARALAPGPRLLLLDEPLSALDRGLREQTRDELLAVQRATGTTSILVTHDQEEALAVAGRIGLLRAGKLVQVGPPAELYERPATLYAAHFMGMTNLFPAVAYGTELEVEGVGSVRAAEPADGRVHVGIRPERVRVFASDGAAGGGASGGAGGTDLFPGSVASVSYRGAALDLHIMLVRGAAILASVPLTAGLGTRAIVGDRVLVALPSDALVVLPA